MTFSETGHPANIAIIGGGFCGIITAIHLLRDNGLPLHIHIINKGYPLAKGVAYHPHTASLLLNVPNGKMSAFTDEPDHYVEWLIKKGSNIDKLATGFSTRQQYGNYLSELWEKSLRKKDGNKKVTVHEDYADNITEADGLLHVSLTASTTLTIDSVVLATGNSLPKLPFSINPALAQSKYYFGDPWNKECIENTNNHDDILIIGNGLTMVDTAIGLAANEYTGTIHTISPHGYRLEPWGDGKIPYTGFNWDELTQGDNSLLNLLKLFNRHRKIAERLNQSFYPVIDSVRPKAQMLWQSFSLAEKQQFIKYLNGFWGSIRHRLPAGMQEIIDDLNSQGRLVTNKGHILAAKESGDSVEVTMNCEGKIKHLAVQRIINCTGPMSDIKQPENKLLNNLAKKGVINAGPCGLGIKTHAADGGVVTEKQGSKPNLFVIGANLKGTLWESTAVPELRLQAKNIAQQILSGIYAKYSQVVEP